MTKSLMSVWSGAANDDGDDGRLRSAVNNDGKRKIGGDE